MPVDSSIAETMTGFPIRAAMCRNHSGAISNIQPPFSKKSQFLAQNQ
jgi:hypothetical protein